MFGDDIRIDIEVTGDEAARRDLNRVGDASSSVGGMFTGMSGKAKAAGAAVAVAAATMAVDVGMQLGTMGLELDLMGKRVDTVFGDEAASINAWSEEVNRSMGTSAQRVAGLTANVGDLLIPLGFTREQAAGMSRDVLETASALDLWSTSTNSVEEATEILNAALLGERERLKGLGISLTQAELDAALLERGLGDLEGQERKLAEATVTLELVQRKSADALAFASSEGAEQQLVIRDLQARWAELRDGLAERFLPIAIAVAEKIADIADWISTQAIPAIQDWWDENDQLREGLSDLWDGLTDIIGIVMNVVGVVAGEAIPIIGELAGVLGNIIGIAADVVGALVDVVGAIGGAASAVGNFLFGGESMGDKLRREAHESLIAAGEFEAAAALYEQSADRISTSRRKVRETPPIVLEELPFNGAPVLDIPDVPTGLFGYGGPGSLNSGGFYASGGVVPARTGGTQVTVGEAGEDEFILPASRLAGLLGSNDEGGQVIPMPGMASSSTIVNYAINVNAGLGVDGGQLAGEIVELIRGYERRNGAAWRAA